jgi:hypothetical protein
MLANFRVEALVKGKLLVNAVLLALVAGLALWMTLRPGTTPVATQRVSQLKAADVASIRIARDGLPEIVLERDGRKWIQTAPFRARTDATQAGRLLDLLAAEAAVTFPAEDLARFELDKPFAKVTIGSPGFSSVPSGRVRGAGSETGAAIRVSMPSWMALMRPCQWRGKLESWKPVGVTFQLAAARVCRR